MSDSGTTVDQALERAVELARSSRRTVLGIAGAPGAGKSTLARRIVTEVDGRLGAGTAVQVPMDGFHLSNAALDALGRHDRKGAADTFDADGYVALVRRLVAADEDVVWAPDFDRRVDEPVAGSIAVPRAARLVVSEGNYLLDDAAPWSALPEALHGDLVLRRPRRRAARPPGRPAHAARPRPRRRPRVGGGGGRRERREGRTHGDPGLQDGVDVTTDQRDRRRPPDDPDNDVTPTTTTRHRHEERP
ncbi:nucleoside/nucleotide kinase family protein [Curtobacterium flaccumfaciens]|uniref:nucleoside/nucleotide kinase family protein n=1 Tax=Curtobacterium flaccumfaciens TaxID=2035 RepID=UPI0021C8F7A8|nr:nucleoside/nucleotide kinase family protein [Curtobacterium flaccumfaciens]